MTTPTSATAFTDPAPAQRLERTAAALMAHGFAAEILDDAAAARDRVKDWSQGARACLPGPARRFGCPASTRTSTQAADMRHQAARMDAGPGRADEFRRLSPARTSRRQRRRGHRDRLAGDRLGQRQPAARLRRRRRPRDLGRRRAEGGARPEGRAAPGRGFALPLENARAQVVYGVPSAVNRLLILNAEPHPGAAPCCSCARPSGSRAAVCWRPCPECGAWSQ